MSSVYQRIVDGLHTRFATISGLKQILDYEPLTIHEAPILYSLFDRMTPEYDNGAATFARPFARHPIAKTYRILHRVVFRWVDVEQAEQEIQPYVDAITDAVEADTTAGGVTLKNLSHIVEVQGVFVTIGGTIYRCLDCYSETTVMSLYPAK